MRYYDSIISRKLKGRMDRLWKNEQAFERTNKTVCLRLFICGKEYLVALKIKYKLTMKIIIALVFSFLAEHLYAQAFWR